MTHRFQARLRATLTGPTDSAHDTAHADRVYRNALTIAATEGTFDDAVLICACYLHDLVTLPKDALNRAEASRLSAEKARPLLKDFGLTGAQIQAVQHAIIAHSFSAQVQPETLEAKIVQDADRIESLGAIGLARVFAVSGGLNRPLFDGKDPFARNRPFDDSTYAIDHFQQKLLRLPETMQTSAGRDLAHQRASVLRTYLKDLADELGQDPPSW